MQPRRTREGERGFAALEVLFMGTLILVVITVILHFFSAIYVGQAAQRIAWDAARAHSLGQSASAAASGAAPGAVDVVSVRTLGDGVEVTVESPSVFPWMDKPRATTRAYVP